MRLLLFSDLHCDADAARRLVEQARHGNVDVAVGAGDFGNGRRGLDVCLPILRELPCPVVLVPGNNESFDELSAACADWAQAHVLHGTAVTIRGVSFFGLGGGIPVTPFGAWSFDLSEDEAERHLANCPNGGVLVVHSPPKGVLDRSSSGASLGSTAIRSTVERIRPVLVVCGHVHACGGLSEMLGATTVVNAGPEGVVMGVARLGFDRV